MSEETESPASKKVASPRKRRASGRAKGSVIAAVGAWMGEWTRTQVLALAGSALVGGVFCPIVAPSQPKAADMGGSQAISQSVASAPGLTVTVTVSQDGRSKIPAATALPAPETAQAQILYGAGTFLPLPEALGDIQRVSEWLKSYPAYSVHIHPDVGLAHKRGAHYNLPYLRSTVVRDYLKQYGVAEAQIHLDSFFIQKPGTQVYYWKDPLNSVTLYFARDRGV